MLKTLAVLVFIGGVGTLAVYAAQRPTIARGEVLGAVLVEANHATVRGMTCDPEIPIGVQGATFSCRAELKDGSVQQVQFQMDRAGQIHPVQQGAAPRIKKTSDPWGD